MIQPNSILQKRLRNIDIFGAILTVAFASFFSAELLAADKIPTQQTDTIEYHSLMTRQAGQRKFISLHLLVPGEWSVQQGHDFAEKIEESIEDMFSEPVTVSSHIEPIEDPASMRDIGIDRKKITENNQFTITKS